MASSPASLDTHLSAGNFVYDFPEIESQLGNVEERSAHPIRSEQSSGLYLGQWKSDKVHGRGTKVLTGGAIY